VNSIIDQQRDEPIILSLAGRELSFQRLPELMEFFESLSGWYEETNVYTKDEWDSFKEKHLISNE